MVSPERLSFLLPRAASWAAQKETRILGHGVPLTPIGFADAQSIGIQLPEKARLLAVSEIPMPDDPVLQAAAEATGLISPFTIGLTLRYGIFYREDEINNRRLIAHELVHTHQYERLGGFAQNSSRLIFSNA